MVAKPKTYQECGTCSAMITDYHMVKHMRLHDPSRPHRCTLGCSAMFFLNRAGLAKHCRAMHTRKHSSTVAVVQCPICHMSMRKSGMRNHRLTHDSTRPYQCLLGCKELYYEKKVYLAQHKRVAHRRRPGMTKYGGIKAEYIARHSQDVNQPSTSTANVHVGESLIDAIGRAAWSTSNDNHLKREPRQTIPFEIITPDNDDQDMSPISSASPPCHPSGSPLPQLPAVTASPCDVSTPGQAPIDDTGTGVKRIIVNRSHGNAASPDTLPSPNRHRDSTPTEQQAPTSSTAPSTSTTTVNAGPRLRTRIDAVGPLAVPWLTPADDARLANFITNLPSGVCENVRNFFLEMRGTRPTTLPSSNFDAAHRLSVILIDLQRCRPPCEWALEKYIFDKRASYLSAIEEQKRREKR